MNSIQRHDKGRWQEAITLLREVIDELAAIRSVASKDEIRGIDIQRTESVRRRYLAALLWDHAAEIQKKGEAQDLGLNFLDQAVIEVKEAVRLSPGKAADESLSLVYSKRGDSYMRLKRYEEAAADRIERVAALRRLVPPEKGIEGKLDLVFGLNAVTSAWVKAKRFPDAKLAVDEAWEILEGIVEAKPNDSVAKGHLIAVGSTAIQVANGIKDFDTVRAVSARRLVLAEDLLSRENVGVQPLVQAYYAFSGNASYRRYSKIGERGNWIELYEKAIEVVNRIENAGKLSVAMRKGREGCLSSIKELRGDQAN